MKSFPASGSPFPVSSLIVSATSMEPITPQAAPTIGNTSRGELSGKKQRRQGPFPGIIVVAWPKKPRTAP